MFTNFTNITRFTSSFLAMLLALALSLGSISIGSAQGNSDVQDIIFMDGFESGDLSAWSSSVTRNGLLSVSTEAPLVDSYSLKAIVSQGNAVYVVDESPAAEPRYRARFYFDPNSLTMGNGESHYIFVAASDDTLPMGGTVMRVDFRFMDGEYQLRTNHLLSNGTTFNNSNWFPISDALHFVELDWRTATAAGANDGGLMLWIDGVQKADLAGIDNPWRIDRVRLGAVSGIDAGTTGTYYFDAFESRQETYIGHVSSGTNHPPLVTIGAPADGSTFNVSNTVSFNGMASDIEDGDVTAGIIWDVDQIIIGTGGTFSRSDLSVGVHTITASITDSGGLTASASATITVFADAPILVGAGDIADDRDYDEATATLLETIPGTVVTLGDNAYPSGTEAEYNTFYEPTWGRHKARTKPAAGNHEYYTPGAVPYFNYFGAAAGDPDKGYYSYNVGDWHIITLNTECSLVGGCGSTDPQGQWLQADLAANQNACTLAVLHKPVFSSGAKSSDGQAYWQILYQAGADVVLSGHAHVYERFAMQDPNGVADPVGGIREFVVGTGGSNLHNPGPLAPNTEVRNTTSFGVLKLTLHPIGYDWEFIPIAGQSFTDSGSDNCVGVGETHTVTFDANGGTGTMDPQTANFPTALTLNTFANTGYNFVGWNTAPDGSGKAYENGATYDFGTDITLYAQWTVLTYTLNYTAGPNGTLSGETVQVTTYGNDGTPVTALPNAGYHFVDWSDGVLTAERTDTNVTANLSVTANFAIDALIDTVASSEIPVAGRVIGNYTATYQDDGVVESITERESGGKPSTRYSYLEHKWVFNVTSGNVNTLYANAWSSGSNDEDSFIFAYSTDDVNYIDMFTVNATTDDAPLAYVLPSSTQGTVYIRVTDSNRFAGNLGLDTVSVDHLYIRSETQLGSPPAPPSALSAAAISAGQIDLFWNAETTIDEDGFYIQRSVDGSNWNLINIVGADEMAFTDLTVFPNTTYYYRVSAYNVSGSSGYTDPASATTPNGLILTGTGYKVKGFQMVDLIWSGSTATSFDIYRNGNPLISGVTGTKYIDNINRKGSGSYEYRVCEAGSSTNCSNILLIIF